MTAVDHNSLCKLVEGQLLRLEGNAFQDCMDRLGLELYPGDYQPVRAAGPKGDTKNDGYCPMARVFFAARATRGERIDKTKAKIRSDLEGCLQEHRDVEVWRFLTNNTLAGEVDQFIDNELRPRYRGVTIEVWGLKRLADVISKLKLVQVAVVGKPLTIRRTTRKGDQTYTCTTGDEVSRKDEVTISYTYGVLVQRHGHTLHLDLGQPTMNFWAELWYSDCDIRRMNVIDYLSGPRRPRYRHLENNGDQSLPASMM